MPCQMAFSLIESPKNLCSLGIHNAMRPDSTGKRKWIVKISKCQQTILQFATRGNADACHLLLSCSPVGKVDEVFLAAAVFGASAVAF